MKSIFHHGTSVWNAAYGLVALAVLCVIGGAASAMWLAPATDSEHEALLAEGRAELGRLQQAVVATCRTASPENATPGDVRWPVSTAAPLFTTCCDERIDGDGDHRCDGQPLVSADESWKAIGFVPQRPSPFVFRYEQVQTARGQTWKISATADLACDGRRTTLELMGPDPAQGVPQPCPEGSWPGSSWEDPNPTIFRETETE